MEWQDWARTLVDVLEVEVAPVAVTYTDTPPPDASDRTCRACTAIASGATILRAMANSSKPPVNPTEHVIFAAINDYGPSGHLRVRRPAVRTDPAAARLWERVPDPRNHD